MTTPPPRYAGLPGPFQGPRGAGSPAPLAPRFRASMALSARADSRRPIDRIAGVAVPLAQGPGPPPRLRLHRRQAAARCCLTADLGPPSPLVPPAAGHRLGGVQPPSPPRSVGAGQRPAKALASLPPSVARCRPLSLPLIGPAVAELPRPAMSDPPQAPVGQAAQGVGNREASCALPLSGHTTPMVPAAHPRQDNPGTAADCGRGRLQAVPPQRQRLPLATRARPRPLSRVARSVQLPTSVGPSGHPARFFPVSSWGEDREKTSFFAWERRAQRRRQVERWFVVL